jgi:hypothetical protein
MTKAATYDWSALDRDLVAEMISYASVSTVGKSLSPTKFASKIRSIFRFFAIPVKVRSNYKTETDKNAVWVGGLYDGSADKKGKTSITISLQFHSKDSTVKIKSPLFKRMCYSVADTLMHEIIHMRQYRRRNFKDIPGYHSTASLAKKRNEQIYLGHNDEIDAYSFNIACQLLDRFNSDGRKVANYLNKDLNDRRYKKDGYRMYLDTFDHDHSHRVIKKLKKKVINYLPNALEVAKPYKTSDWLKK